jgi:hypothetical protein
MELATFTRERGVAQAVRKGPSPASSTIVALASHTHLYRLPKKKMETFVWPGLRSVVAYVIQHHLTYNWHNISLNDLTLE